MNHNPTEHSSHFSSSLKTVKGLSIFSSFSHSGSKVEATVEFIFHFSHSRTETWKTIPSVFHAATMLVKTTKKHRRVYWFSRLTRKIMEWCERSLFPSRSLNLEHFSHFWRIVCLDDVSPWPEWISYISKGWEFAFRSFFRLLKTEKFHWVLFLWTR